MKRVDRIRNALEAIRRANGGRLTSAFVVAAAKPKTHPLHREFEWDDRKAAHRNRLDRADELIRFVTIVVIHKPVRIVSPYYVRDPNAGPNEEGRIALTSDEISRTDSEQIMLNELARCEGCIDRARGVAALLDQKYPGITHELEQALARIIDVRRRISARKKKAVEHEARVS